MACRRCGSKVQPEKDDWLRKEYPYYCPDCDENMYSFECMEMWPQNVPGDVQPNMTMREENNDEG